MGERRGLIETALGKLAGPDLALRRVSRFYETEPIGLREQPWFLNVAAEFGAALPPLKLLARIHEVEREMGRVRTIPNGPRTIDIDILLFGGQVMSTAELEIPHPRYRERRFTLAPLAELSPALTDPVTGRTMREMLAELEGQAVRVIAAGPAES